MAGLLTTATKEECARHAPPEGISLTISTPKSTYYPGEWMLVDFTYTNHSTETLIMEERPCAKQLDGEERNWVRNLNWYARDATGRPAADPLKGYMDVQFAPSGCTTGEKAVKPGEIYTESYTANEWLCLDQPGDYKLCVTMGSIGMTYQPGLGTHAWGLKWMLRSNEIDVHIRAIPRKEFRKLADELTSTVRERDKYRGSFTENFHLACQRLRDLHSLEAVPIYLELLNDEMESENATRGLVGIPQTTEALALLREHVSKPDHAITRNEVEVFACLAAKLDPSKGQRPMLNGPRNYEEISGIARDKPEPARGLSLKNLPYDAPVPEPAPAPIR